MLASLLSPLGLSASAICLIPGIVTRSIILCLKGLACGLLVTFITGFVGSLLPYTSWHPTPYILSWFPFIPEIHPHYDHIPLNWEARVLIVFTVFFFFLDVTLLYLLRSRVAFDRRFFRAFLSSVGTMWVLFPISWLGNIWVFSSLWYYYLSIAVFAAIYPMSLVVFFRTANSITLGAGSGENGT